MDTFFEIHVKKFDLAILETTVSQIEHKWSGNRRIKYFNLRSIRNFIYHFESLPNEGVIRQKAYDLLSKYLNQIVGINLDEFDLHDGDDLYENYIYPIGMAYRNYAGFSINPALIPVSYILITCILILLIIRPPLMLFVIVIVGFLTVYLYGFYKRKQKKVFGLFY